MFKVIVPETNASRHLFFTNKRIRREGTVTGTGGAVLFPRRGDPKTRPLPRPARSHPKKLSLKPMDRIADVLPFSKLEPNQVLFHSVNSFAPPPPRLFASWLCFQ